MITRLADWDDNIKKGAEVSIVHRVCAKLRSGVLGRRKRQLHPPIGTTDFGDLRRTEPISRVFGFDRGVPVDRYYIEGFLESNSGAIHGRVLEVGDATYTRRFGGCSVVHSDVLHLTGDSPEATIVADLASAPHIPDDSFDCIILTQTLQFSYDMQAVVAELHRILKPGGSVLCTVPGISQISRFDMDRWGDFWRLTTLSARTLFESAFTPEDVVVQASGNVLASIAFLHGLATSELTLQELDACDEDYQLIISVRATKPQS